MNELDLAGLKNGVIILGLVLEVVFLFLFTFLAIDKKRSIEEKIIFSAIAFVDAIVLSASISTILSM